MAPGKSTKAATANQSKLSFKKTRGATAAVFDAKKAIVKSQPVATVIQPKKEAAASSDSSSDSSGEEVVRPPLKELEQTGQWRKQYGQAKLKMGGLKPIHHDPTEKTLDILRVFDESYEYGPCVGVSRLERWERAEALDLNPPEAVREILLTQEAEAQDEYSQCVFYGEV